MQTQKGALAACAQGGAGMTTHPYIARVGKQFALVLATDETSTFEIDRGVPKSNLWHRVESACVSTYGVVPQHYGVTF